MSAFSDEELRYLRNGGQRRLGRLATVGAETKKFRDVARSGRAAIVIDDLASTDPWRPRAVEVRGRAETVEEPRPLIRIHADRIVSWGLA